MTHSAQRFLALTAVLALAACAPDAWKPAPGYEGFLNDVQKACNFQRIGMTTVGAVLSHPGTVPSSYFVDQTSRLYSGKITADDWTHGVAGFMNGRDDDPGLRCVLEHMQQSKPAN